MKKITALIICVLFTLSACAEEYHSLRYYQDICAGRTVYNAFTTLCYKGTGTVKYSFDVEGGMATDRIYFIVAENEDDAEKNMILVYPNAPMYYALGCYYRSEVENGASTDDTYQLAEVGDRVYLTGKFNLFYSSRGTPYFRIADIIVLEKAAAE